MEATEIIMPNYLDKTNKNLSKRKGQKRFFFFGPPQKPMKKCKFSERNKGDARKEKGRMFILKYGCSSDQPRGRERETE